MNEKLNIKVVISIIFVSIVLGFIYNTFSSDGIDLIRKPLVIKSVSIISDDDSSNVLKGLNLAQALKLYNNNEAIFIDARDQWEFSEKHISGAINIPEFSFDINNSLLAKLSKDKLIVVYCDGDDCDISKRLANELVKIGFTNSYVFLGGMNEWVIATLPIEIGKTL